MTNHSPANSKSNYNQVFLIPKMLIVIALIAHFISGSGCKGQGETNSESADSLTVEVNHSLVRTIDYTIPTPGKYDASTNEYVYDSGKKITIDLPNSAGKLDVGEHSTENRIYHFLADPNAKLDTVKGNWFELTDVKFDPESATLTKESMTQLTNLAAISRAFPTAEFKVGGYTDNTGDAAFNQVLSAKRAQIVAETLQKLGMPREAVAGSEGYGPEWPLADNSSPEGRAQNRRVAVNIKAK